MDAYRRRPKDVLAQQWDGTKASAYILVGTLLQLNHVAAIADGYASQGPDLIEIQTKNGMAKVLSGDWIVKDGAYLTVMKPEEFEREFEKAPPPPKPPVMRGDKSERSSISIQRDG